MAKWKTKHSAPSDSRHSLNSKKSLSLEYKNFVSAMKDGTQMFTIGIPVYFLHITTKCFSS